MALILGCSHNVERKDMMRRMGMNTWKPGILDESWEGAVMVTQDGVIVPVQLSNMAGDEEEGVFKCEGEEQRAHKEAEQETGVVYDNVEYYQDKHPQEQEEKQVYPEDDQQEYSNDNTDNSIGSNLSRNERPNTLLRQVK
ncbi:UNVERIFIED_CONTAM: hypothetical protein HDU68_002182, partial [Siphonaria sp. JEL0065]